MKHPIYIAGMSTMVDRTRRGFRLDEGMAMLARTPAAVDALLRDLPDGWTTVNEGGESWSPFDVVGHLVRAERVDWMGRVRTLLTHGEAEAFASVDRLAQFRESEGRTLATLLDEFASLRRESLRELAALALTEADLDRAGRHPVFGSVTLRQLLSTWVAHDLDHLVQIARVLARQYSDEVGPWRVNLRIINGTPI
ncbi:MAG: DinB family protein [Acidobacteriota bacterium]